MNVTELARILKITPQELHNYLPLLGFDIGARAIKINHDVANRIIRDWPVLKKRLERQRQIEIDKETVKQEATKTKKTIVMHKHISVRDFAAQTGMPINIVLSELMKNGIFVSLNERIDYDTAWLIGSELNVEVKQEEAKEEEGKEEEKLKTILAREESSDMINRPPVIVVMGHVDHGKTKLLDAIRKTNVVAGEAGGITQHIGAYQVEKNGRPLTFVDTPGHEAFTAMRSRGAKIADIAILVVAADDGVKPQTVEAFRIIQSVNIPFIVAINKIDKPEANLDKVKQELSSQLNIIPEDWGGKNICVPVSAKENKGITELLDMILLTADAEAGNIKANPNGSPVGTVIESHLDKGSGPVATILVQNGTLRIGDQLILDRAVIGKVRNLKNYYGESATEAGPAMPVQVIGLKMMPQVGDIIEVGEGDRVKFRKTSSMGQHQSAAGESEEATDQNAKKIFLVVKSDVLGSAEAIEESLEKLNTSEVSVKIIHKGLGNLTEGDIKRAEAVGAVIIGFNVKVPTLIEELAREKNIEIKTYDIIYNLINDIKLKMQLLIGPITKRVDLGKLKVAAVFRTDKTSQIIGGRVIEGRAENNAQIEVMRGQDMVSEGKIVKLQSGKQDVPYVENGQECGIQFEGRPVVQSGDIFVIYKIEKTEAKI